MSTIRYFRKELSETPIRLSNGVPLRFDLLAVEEGQVSKELDIAITRGVGGIVAITQSEYDELLKKKEQEKAYEQSNRLLQQRERISSPNRSDAVAGRMPEATISTRNQVRTPAPLQPSPSKPEPLKVPPSTAFRPAAVKVNLPPPKPNP